MADLARLEAVPEMGGAADMPEKLAIELEVARAQLAGLDDSLLEAIARRLEELKEAAAIDELTGVMRRAAGLVALDGEVRRARRFNDQKLVVAFVDLDDLKAVNDHYGHSAGDRVLRAAATALRRRFRAYDLVMRWGGDEFVCCLPGAGIEAARRALDEIRAELQERIGCSFSVGFAQWSDDADGESMVARADADYYERRRRERCGLSMQSRQGRDAQSPAYSTPIRGVRAMRSGRKPSSAT